jgi:1,4-alpha-glucan branching enzyme
MNDPAQRAWFDSIAQAFGARHDEQLLVAAQERDDTVRFMVHGRDPANRPFDRAYVLENAGIPDAGWLEVLNSDAAVYGGAGVGNGDAPRRSFAGRLEVIVPASGLVVLEAR